MKKAIIIGASSGIGKHLAFILAGKGFKVGVTGRRMELLEELRKESPGNFIPATIDITRTELLAEQLQQLTRDLGGLDLLVISSGIGHLNPTLDFGVEQQVIATNVSGFTAAADWAFNYFQARQQGHLVAVSSIAGLRGSKHAPSYNATKAYQINYMEGLRQKAAQLKMPVFISDIRPGFVDTDMAKGEGLFWVAPVEKAAQQIYAAIEQKKGVTYVTRRWGMIAAVLKRLPNSIYNRM